jgi:non-specific serine/threonine protein kinase
VIGTTISHYKILEKLGTGGMGVVYKAEDARLKRTVALKFLPPDLTRDPEAKQRFIHEAQAASALQHYNICSVHDIDETNDGQLFIVMDCYEGKSLKEKMAGGLMRIEEAADIAIQVAQGLQKAHEKGITHRDVKPGNIIITNDGVVKILDFGLAKLAGQSRLTKTGSTIGTAAYMSPEQAQGLEVDHRTDIWSLGVVLFEMLTGKLPFRGEHEAALLYSVVHEEPQTVTSLRADTQVQVERIIRKSLEKDLARRYQTIQELIADLKAVKSPTMELPKQEKSIVVLPFDNLSPDPDQEYFSDGLTEEVISDLSEVRSLRVISRSSAMTFKGMKKKIPEIAREVNVQYVLEGSVRKSGDNLRITAQLIDATNDAHLWAEKYSGTLDDVFDIQERVSRSIVTALELTLTTDTARKIAERAIDNVAAYEYYLKAYHEIWKFTEDALTRALDYLEKGLAIIGPNAFLYSANAFAYLQSAGIGIKPDEYSKKAKEWAEKALALSPDFPKALAVLGWIEYWKEQTQKSLGYFKRTLAADPNEYAGLHGLAANYFWAGKLEAALSLSERMIELDPLNVLGHNLKASVHFQFGDYETSLECFERAYQMDPENRAIHMHYTWALVGANQPEKGISIIDRIARTSPDNPLIKVGLLLKCGVLKDWDGFRQMMTPEFERVCREKRFLAYAVGNVLVLLGEYEKALDWLEGAVDRGFVNYPRFAKGDPFLEGVRGNVRFKTLLERVKKEWEEFEV